MEIRCAGGGYDLGTFCRNKMRSIKTKMKSANMTAQPMAHERKNRRAQPPFGGAGTDFGSASVLICIKSGVRHAEPQDPCGSSAFTPQAPGESLRFAPGYHLAAPSALKARQTTGQSWKIRVNRPRRLSEFAPIVIGVRVQVFPSDFGTRISDF